MALQGFMRSSLVLDVCKIDWVRYGRWCDTGGLSKASWHLRGRGMRTMRAGGGRDVAGCGWWWWTDL